MSTEVSTKDFSQLADDASIATTQKALEAHGFKVTVVDTLDQARETILTMIPEGSEVFTATSVTVDESGLTKIFNESGKYDSVRKKLSALSGQEGKELEMHRLGSASDYTIGSAQAVTEDGQAVFASATGSQMPGYVYGANHVIWLVGTHKIVKDLNQALERIEQHVLPLEDDRALEAYGVNSSINKILIYRNEGRGRVSIVLVKEAVGY